MKAFLQALGKGLQQLMESSDPQEEIDDDPSQYGSLDGPHNYRGDPPLTISTEEA